MVRAARGIRCRSFASTALGHVVIATPRGLLLDLLATSDRVHAVASSITRLERLLSTRTATAQVHALTQGGKVPHPRREPKTAAVGPLSRRRLLSDRRHPCDEGNVAYGIHRRTLRAGYRCQSPCSTSPWITIAKVP
jgi:hypothetical protein